MSAYQEPTCYVCLQESTHDNAFIDTGCSCSDSMNIHYSCLQQACVAAKITSCTVCKQPYRDIVIRIPVEHRSYVEYVTYLNGKREGLSSTYSLDCHDLLNDTWYESGKRTETHQYDPITNTLDTVIRYDEDGNVTEYVRYDSYGDEVDYEDYSLDPSGMYQAEITAAIEAG